MMNEERNRKGWGTRIGAVLVTLSPSHFVTLSLFAAALGCGGSPPPPPDTLIYGRGEDANTLDPIHTDVGEAVKVMVNIFDTLVTYDEETLDLVPALATEWKESHQGLRWTFKLQEGAVFHDGTPVDAEAVAFSFHRMIDDKHEHVHDSARPYRSAYNMIDRVEAKDAHTVVFHLREPSGIFLKNLAMFSASIVSPAAVKKLGKEFATQPVGSGPFKFKRWKQDQQLVLEAFDDHWRGRPRLNRVIFLPVAEPATSVEQLRRGEIHIADNLPPASINELSDEYGIAIQKQPGINVAYLTMQTEKPPLDNVRVRQAISHAIDKAALASVAYSGYADPAVTMLPPTIAWAYNHEIEDRSFSTLRAKQILESEPDIELPIKLTLAMMSERRPYMQQPLQTASFIRDALAAVGIEVTIQPRSVNQHFDYLKSGKHQLGLAGWSSDNNDPDNFLYMLLDEDNISDHGNNLSRYRNSELHELLLAAQKETDQDQRAQLYKQAQEIIFEDAPVIPLVHAQVRIAQRSILKGYKLHPSSMVRLRNAYFEVPEL